MVSTHDTWKIHCFRACVWALYVMLGAAALFAQFESATLTGVVTDSSGHVIPNVPVKAIHEGTSVEAVATTNGEGRYNFPSLRPGSYRVVAATSGFKQFVSSGLVLSGLRPKQVTLSCGRQAIPMLPQFGIGPEPRPQLRQPSVHLMQVLSTSP